MTRAKAKAKGTSTAATLGIERDIAQKKRDLKDIDRIIEQAKRDEKARRGGELVGRVPPMFLDIPESIIGGAESYFQEILSSTSRGFARAFGEVKGARQIQIEAFRQFEKARDSETQEDMDYITIASHIVVLIAFHLVSIAEDKGLNIFDQKAIARLGVTTFRESFAGAAPKGIIESLNLVLLASFTPTSASPSTIGAVLGIAANPQALVYPLSLNWIKAKEKMITKKFVGAKEKAEFLLKANVLLAYRKYAAKHEPKDSVALPSQISGKAADQLVKFFQQSSVYSLEDTFLFYRAAYNASSNVRKEGEKQEMASKLRVAEKAFDSFIDELKASFFYESVGEAQEFKKQYLELLKGNPTAEDFASATYLIQQAKNPDVLTFSGSTTAYLTGIENLGQEVFSDLDLVEMLKKAASTDVETVDKGVWNAFQKLEQINNDITQAMLGASVASKIEDELVAAFTELKTSGAGAALAGNVTSDFKTQVNKLLKETVQEIAGSYNLTFKDEISDASGAITTAAIMKKVVTDSAVSILNSMLKGYTEADAFEAAGAKLNEAVEPAFNADAIVILAEGDSIDIYNADTDEFGNQEVDIELENLRQRFIAEGIPNQLFNDVENFIIDSAEVLQVVLDSAYQEALRDPDIAIFNNPYELKYGTAALVGIGAGAMVGTHAVTALSQRLLNSEGKTEGGAFYAAESLAPLAVAATGFYLHAHSREHGQLGIPLMAGAAGSVLLRIISRMYKDHAISKYLGIAPAEFLGDKTFGAAAPVGGYISTGGLGAGFFDQEGVDNLEDYAGLGRYEQVPMHDPFYSYNPPTEISYGQANQMLEQGGRMYAAPAGLGRYEQVPMHDPFYSYNPPTEISYGQANQMLEQGGRMYAAPAGLDGVDEEVLDILDNAEPLTSHEIMEEGLDGYVDETVIQLKPASAQKVQNAGAGEIIAQSKKIPNTMLLRVGNSEVGVTGMEGGIVKEYNPSLPSGDWGAPQIVGAPANNIETSGLFSRGAFSSRLPSINESFDY